MSTRQKFIEFRAKVADPRNYPGTPVGARELFLKNLDELLLLTADVDEKEFERRANGFCLGATRALTGDCYYDCDELLNDMPDVPSR